MYVWNNHVNEYGIEDALNFYYNKLIVITVYIAHAWNVNKIIFFSPLFIIYICGYIEYQRK